MFTRTRENKIQLIVSDAAIIFQGFLLNVQCTIYGNGITYGIIIFNFLQQKVFKLSNHFLF